MQPSAFYEFIVLCARVSVCIVDDVWHLVRASPSENKERWRFPPFSLSLSFFLVDFFFLSLEFHFIFPVPLSFVVVCVGARNKYNSTTECVRFSVIRVPFCHIIGWTQTTEHNFTPSKAQNKTLQTQQIIYKFDKMQFFCFHLFSLFASFSFRDVVAIVVPWLPYLRRCFVFSLWHTACLFCAFFLVLFISSFVLNRRRVNVCCSINRK